MFVVVVLRTQPRVHIIVPEKYICGLKELEDDLKTWGVNKKHDHLIFWSKDLLNDDSPDETFEPDFNAVSCDVFPPPRQVNAACYIGRIKCFYSKNKTFILIGFRNCYYIISLFIFIESFDAAKQFCDRFRPVLPVAYNSSVLNKQPTPPNNMNNPANGYNEEDSETDEQQSVVNEIGDVSIAQDDLVSENSEEMDLENAEAVEQNTNDEEKYVLAPVNMDQSDTIAFESLFDDNSACDGESVATDNTSQQVHLRIETNENGREINNDSTNEVNIDDPSNQIVETAAIQHQNSNDTTTAEDENVPDEESNTLLRSYKPAENEKVAFTQDGRIEITKTIDEELEMTFILGQQLTAMQDRFHVKMNDKLSGNLPFQENVYASRCYF